jgi:hypothetical protein
MNKRLLIIVPCRDRKVLTRHALETLLISKAPQDTLAIFNDGSTEFTPDWLAAFSDMVFNMKAPVGIEGQRKMHFQFAAKMFEAYPDYTDIYLTDSDTIHDPKWREQAFKLQALAKDAPLCLYDTTAHSCLEGNTIEDDPESLLLWRKYAPGVSYLMTADHLSVVAGRVHALANWDWDVPDMLGNRFAISRIGYVDHIGVGGMHHPSHEDANGGDRVKVPTPWLQNKRKEVIAELLK